MDVIILYTLTRLLNALNDCLLYKDVLAAKAKPLMIEISLVVKLDLSNFT